MLSNNNHNFFCVGVMYSGEYDACDWIGLPHTLHPGNSLFVLRELIRY
jgi:hypothetical protein